MSWWHVLLDYAPKAITVLTGSAVIYRAVSTFLSGQSPRKRARTDYKMLEKLHAFDLDPNRQSPKRDARLEYWWAGMREGFRSLSASEIRYLSNIRPVSRAWRDYGGAYDNLKIAPKGDGEGLAIQVRSKFVHWGIAIVSPLSYSIGSILVLLPVWEIRRMSTARDVIGGVTVAVVGAIMFALGAKGIGFSGSAFRILKMQEEAIRDPAPWLLSGVESDKAAELTVLRTRDDLSATDEAESSDAESETRNCPPRRIRRFKTTGSTAVSR